MKKQPKKAAVFLCRNSDYFFKSTRSGIVRLRRLRYIASVGCSILRKERSKMKRAVLAIRNGLVAEAVALAFRKSGLFTEKTSSQSAPEILLACEAAKAHLLVMDVTRNGEGTFDLRMQTVKSVKAQNPDIKVALLCDKVSDAAIADKVKCAKEEGAIDAFFYESVPSDYLADALDAL